MNFKDINIGMSFKYLGLFIATIIVIYIMYKSFSIQKQMAREPFLTMSGDLESLEVSKSVDAVKTTNSKFEDVTLFDKYRTDYEGLIISLDDYSRYVMFSSVINIGDKLKALNGKLISADILTDIHHANAMREFSDTLNASMKFLDSKKSAKSAVAGILGK
jgi:hypothetical protein